MKRHWRRHKDVLEVIRRLLMLVQEEKCFGHIKIVLLANQEHVLKVVFMQKHAFYGVVIDGGFGNLNQNVGNFLLFITPMCNYNNIVYMIII